MKGHPIAGILIGGTLAGLAWAGYKKATGQPLTTNYIPFVVGAVAGYFLAR